LVVFAHDILPKSASVAGLTTAEHLLSRQLAGKKNAAFAAFLPIHRSVLALVDDLVGTDPRHHATQLLTDLLDRVCRVVATVRGHGRVVVCAFSDEHLGVLTVLDALEGIAHGLAGLLVDHLGAGHVFTVLGIVGDRVVHVGDAALVHQVDDQLELVQALEVRHFRRIAGFHQRLEAGLDQLHRATTEHCLLTEQVGFGLVLEGGLNDAGAAAADATGIGQGNVPGLARGILEDGDQVRDAAALDELGAHRVARRLRRNHDHVEVGTRHDLVVVDGKTVGKRQGGAFLQVRLDLVLVQLRLELIRGQHHDDVSPLYRFRYRLHGQAGLLRLGRRGRTRAQGDNHLDAGILQVVGMRVALGAVADDRYLLALDDGEVAIFVVIDVHGFPRLGFAAAYA